MAAAETKAFLDNELKAMKQLIASSGMTKAEAPAPAAETEEVTRTDLARSRARAAACRLRFVPRAVETGGGVLGRNGGD